MCGVCLLSGCLWQKTTVAFTGQRALWGLHGGGAGWGREGGGQPGLGRGQLQRALHTGGGFFCVFFCIYFFLVWLKCVLWIGCMLCGETRVLPEQLGQEENCRSVRAGLGEERAARTRLRHDRFSQRWR